MTTKSTRNLPFNAIINDDVVAVGDLDSEERGSGARKNAGKLPMDLVPVRLWLSRWRHSGGFEFEMALALEAVAEFQEGDLDALLRWLVDDCAQDWMEEAVRVLEFGATKYKAWNWAKGMPWSVCIGCILRHAQAIKNGEDYDPDSGRLHIGHIVCNIIFLNHYTTTYPEGNDMPPSQVSSV
jgi:hypothetical protein